LKRKPGVVRQEGKGGAPPKKPSWPKVILYEKKKENLGGETSQRRLGRENPKKHTKRERKISEDLGGEGKSGSTLV